MGPFRFQDPVPGPLQGEADPKPHRRLVLHQEHRGHAFSLASPVSGVCQALYLTGFPGPCYPSKG
ncbi:hypothetical protein TJA_24870 [Thermus sp. LT1-2-5]